LCVADLLVTSLPESFQSQEEQMEVIRELSEKNDEAGQRLNQSKQEAQVWEERVSNAVTKVATEQFESHELVEVKEAHRTVT
jgi:hypothetical protein